MWKERKDITIVQTDQEASLGETLRRVESENFWK